MKIHYAGEIIWAGGNILPGWAACCSGNKTIAIRNRGNHSYDEEDVTCKSCLRMIQRHKDYALRNA